MTFDFRTRLPAPSRRIQPPRGYSGTLEAFVDVHIAKTFLEPAAVEEFHRALLRTLRREDATLAVRNVAGFDRGSVREAGDGAKMVGTDNAPSWWVYALLSSDARMPPEAIALALEHLPSHMFEVRRRCAWYPSLDGWHVAHILAAKDGNTDTSSWTRRDVVRRFVRNVHPCNFFLWPKAADWRRLGGDPQLLGIMRERFASLYAGVWEEFLELAGAGIASSSKGRSATRTISYGVDVQQRARAREKPAIAPRSSGVWYCATRLLFKRAIIDALADDDRFDIVTPVGRFSMTKREFLDTFGKITQTKSWKDAGIYHYPTVPQAAMRFLVDGFG